MTTDRLKPALDCLIDAQAENALQDRLLFNPDATVNSLIERVVELRSYGVPEPPLRALLCDLRTMLLSNGRERHGERGATGVLDELLRTMHTAGMRSQIRVRELARAIRPLIRTEMNGVQPHAMVARRDLLRLADTYGPDKLLCAGIRGQLTSRQYARLETILKDAD